MCLSNYMTLSAPSMSPDSKTCYNTSTPRTKHRARRIGCKQAEPRMSRVPLCPGNRKEELTNAIWSVCASILAWPLRMLRYLRFNAEHATTQAWPCSACCLSRAASLLSQGSRSLSVRGSPDLIFAATHEVRGRRQRKGQRVHVCCLKTLCKTGPSR